MADTTNATAGSADGAATLAPAPNVAALPASMIREVANSAMGRPDVLAFWFGEPSQVTGREIRERAIAALASGDTFYLPNLGLPALREAIADYATRLHGDAAPGAIDASRIAVTSSGVSGLMLAIQTLVGAGDRVVVVTPVWPNLPAMPALLGAQVVRVGLTIDAARRRWQLDLDRLLAALAPGTRLLLINSPGNPTGWTIDADAIAAVRAHCRRHGIWILSDEAYERLAFGRDRAPSFLDGADPGERLVVANTFSKTWQMTGWRLGWLTLPAGLVGQVEKLIEFNTSCAPGFVQQAGLAALAGGEAPIRAFAALVEAGTRALVAELDRIPGIALVEPQGAMYLMLRIAGAGASLPLARRLVAEAGLGLAPGAAFGAESEGWLRWCTARPADELRLGASRLADFMERNRSCFGTQQRP